MRIRLLTFVAFLGLLFPGTFVHAAPTAADDTAMQKVLTTLVSAINRGDVTMAVSLVSEDSPELQNEIREAFGAGSYTYALDCAPWENHRDEIADGSVSVSCTYSFAAEKAAGSVTWSMSGLSTNFVFMQNDAGEWRLVDAEFARQMLPSATFAAMGTIVSVMLGVCLLIGAFWLWMFIDCLRRDFKDKVLWVVLMLFIGPLASVLYLFLVKRKSTKKV